MLAVRRLLPVAAVGLLAAAAWALEASATLLSGDRLIGTIVGAGEQHSLSIYVPEGSILSVDALAYRDSTVLPDLAVLDPADVPYDLTAVSRPGPDGVGVRVRGLPVPAAGGGVHDFNVTATGGSSGKYFFRCSARMPKRFQETSSVAAAGTGSLFFDAPAGSTLRFSMASSEGGSTLASPTLVAPDASTTALAGNSGFGVALAQDGTWELRVQNGAAVQADVTIRAALRIPPSRRLLYLSPGGFGPAPRVRSVDPRAVLDDRAYTGITITGEDFDPAADLRLERTGQAPLLPSTFAVVDPQTITADFDFTGVLPGGWKVVVEHPSGGLDTKGLPVVDAAKVLLPPGVVAGTEVWWIDFDGPLFRADLKAAGLRDPDLATVSKLMEKSIQAYALRWLRVAFDVSPIDGSLGVGSVPVSFVLAQPPAIVGAPGTEYDRLAVGGEAGALDTSSNPNYAWGDGPLDAGNVLYEDLSPAPGMESLGVRTRFLAFDPAACVPAFSDALQALRDRPLTMADERLFLPTFAARDSIEGARYAEVVNAIETAGRELGGVLAHFIGRSMGTADSAAGLSATPLLVGEFESLVDFGFTQAETDAMALVPRAGLPGVSKALKPPTLAYTETVDFLLPNCTTTEPYSKAFGIVGGRPERLPTDLQFTVITGSLPAGLTLGPDGTISGTSPLRNPNGTLANGVFRILVRMTDVPAGTSITFGHRINLLVDTTDISLTPDEVNLGLQLNQATITQP